MGVIEHKAFTRAAEEFVAHPSRPKPITEMMRLACEGRSKGIRLWAATWLLANVNIRVITDPIQEPNHATPAPAATIL